MRSRKEQRALAKNTSNVVGAKSVVTSNHLHLDSNGNEFKAKVDTGMATSTKNRVPRFG